VRVNAVAPRMVRTGLHEAAGLPGGLEKYARQIPMGRAGEPAEIAEAVLFLLSASSSFTAGAVLDAVAAGDRPNTVCQTRMTFSHRCPSNGTPGDGEITIGPGTWSPRFRWANAVQLWEAAT
jgi:hypothetical protein